PVPSPPQREWRGRIALWRYNPVMKRRLFTLASVVSLLLTFAVITTWIRSYLTTDVIVRTTRDGRHFEFATIPGQIRLTFTKGWPRQADPRWYSGDLHWYTGRFPA